MRVIYNETTLGIVTTTESDGSITNFPAGLQAIQGSIESIIVQAAALGLDLSQIPGLNLSTEEIRVRSRIAFAEKIRIKFLVENNKNTISSAENLAQMQAFFPVQQLLENNATQTAREILALIPAEAFVL